MTETNEIIPAVALDFVRAQFKKSTKNIAVVTY